MDPRNETMTEMVKIVVVDDHPITRAGLVTHLRQAGLAVVGELGAVEMIEEVRPLPDVVVCDLHLPGRSGAAAIEYLCGLGCVVLATSGVARADEVLDAIAAGARGFLAKSVPAVTFAQAVEVLAMGMYYVSPELASYLLDDLRVRPLVQGEIGPTSRAVLGALARGDTADEVAQTLGLSREALASACSQIWDAERRRRRRYMPSPRERQVIILAAQGLSHKEISAQLGITPAWLSEILEHIRDKYVVTHPEVGPAIAPLAAARRWAAEMWLV